MTETLIYRGISSITNNPYYFASLDLKHPKSWWSEDKSKAELFTEGFGWVLGAKVNEELIDKYKSCSEKPRVYNIPEEISCTLNIKIEEVMDKARINVWKKAGFYVPEYLTLI